MVDNSEKTSYSGYLPNNVHSKLKSKAALKGMPLYDYIEEILTKEAEKDE